MPWLQSAMSEFDGSESGTGREMGSGVVAVIAGWLMLWWRYFEGGLKQLDEEK
ncbi:MAG: hypothetical protein U5L98_15035 [Halomonas sp.]|uniref:hypothetical protein n=1 Tax=Halomonas sp. TaxID=1486246 RepID=UPI002ACE2075|nr:hypothetical protein [Halomonas sp.]MDZ7853915.1 hypothetical protein [Halomonas sp.]